MSATTLWNGAPIPEHRYHGRKTCQEITIRRGHSKLTISVGNSIYAIPDENFWPPGVETIKHFRQKGSELGDVYMVGRVEEIYEGVSRVSGPLCRIRWFAFGNDLKEQLPQDVRDAQHLFALGPHEYILTNVKATYSVDIIEHQCFMERFNDSEANVPWMLDNTPFWRNKMKAGKIQWVKICDDGCGKSNVYTPNVDQVRWCSMCTRWFHDGCCEELDLHADETRKWLRNNNQDYILVDWATVDADHPSIEAIVGLPIARHPAEPAAPESLEKVIILAREKVIFAEEELDLIDYHDFIVEADANHWPDKVEEIVQVFLEEAIEEQPKFYLCPQCNNYAI